MWYIDCQFIVLLHNREHTYIKCQNNTLKDTNILNIDKMYTNLTDTEPSSYEAEKNSYHMYEDTKYCSAPKIDLYERKLQQIPEVS